MDAIIKETANMLKAGTPAVFAEIALNARGYNEAEAEGIVWAAQTHNETPDQVYFNSIESNFRAQLNAR